eukprot:3941546-Rhodomonas_salina.1
MPLIAAGQDPEPGARGRGRPVGHEGSLGCRMRGTERASSCRATMRSFERGIKCFLRRNQRLSRAAQYSLYQRGQ